MSTLESEIQAYEKATPPSIFDASDVVKGLQLILAALVQMSNQLQAIGGQSGKSLVAPAVGSAQTTQTVLALTFSLDPSRLNEILIGTPAIAAYISGIATQVPTMVPAGGTVVLVFPVPPGYVVSTVGDQTMTSTNVGAEVVVGVTIDGHNAIGPQGLIAGPSVSFRAGQYDYAKDEGVVITLTNTSTTDVIIYFSGENLYIARSFYDNFIAPILNAAYEQIVSVFGLSGL